MKALSTYIMTVANIYDAHDWFVLKYGFSFDDTDSMYYGDHFTLKDSYTAIHVHIHRNVDYDGDEPEVYYDGYDEEAPVVAITSYGAIHPVFAHAMNHPELFIPVRKFSVYDGDVMIYEGPVPFLDGMLQRLNAADSG